MDANKTSEYIESYYRTNRSHVAWSFWASMFALIVGLLVLIAGIFLAFSGSNNALSIATTSAGVLTQFISAGFFIFITKIYVN